MARKYNHANVLALSLRTTSPPMGRARSSRPSWPRADGRAGSSTSATRSVLGGVEPRSAD